MQGPEDKFQEKIKAGEKDRAGSPRPLLHMEDRLIKIVESDPEGGREKVSLFAARCGLRVFPLAVSGILSRSEELEKYGKSEWLGIIWRALIVGWTCNQKLAAADYAAAYANEAVANDARNSVFATKSAATAAIATNSAAYNAAYDDGAEAATATEAANRSAGQFDLKMFDNPDFTALDLRGKPLWPESKVPEFISDTHWQTVITAWVSEHLDDEDDSKILILSKISRDYESILKVYWIEGLTRDIADEKPQKDSPSDIDCLGRDQLVKALAPRLSQKDNKDHLTIGLLGDWGIGKSSVIMQLRKKLNEVEHCDYVFGEFNAWSYEHTSNLQAGIAHEVISALTTSQVRKSESSENPENSLLPEKHNGLGIVVGVINPM